MKSIDFLPSSYHELAAKRKTKIWRCSVVALFGSAVAMAAVVQFWCWRDSKRQLNQIEAQYTQSQTQRQLHEKLLADYQEAQRDAALYAYLKFPWPRTQLLSHVTAKLPESIKLGELRIALEVKEIKGSRTPTPEPAAADAAAPTTPGALAEADLKKLRHENDAQVSVIYVSGLTSDAAELHEYVAHLTQSPLVSAAELRSLESAPELRKADQEFSRFNLRLVVRPGYGQPGGPTEPLLLPPSRDESFTSADGIELEEAANNNSAADFSANAPSSTGSESFLNLEGASSNVAGRGEQ